MPRIIIFGNSGSGKTTLALDKAGALNCPHLDLDTVAWDEDSCAPTRRPLADSARLIAPFVETHESWVIEGCYGDLLELVLPRSTEIIFLNPGVETCKDNCRKRPWEPHKYSSAEDQDANLEMLLDWVEQYPGRTDEFSLQAHRQIFDNYAGKKIEYTSNQRPARGACSK